MYNKYEVGNSSYNFVWKIVCIIYVDPNFKKFETLDYKYLNFSRLIKKKQQIKNFKIPQAKVMSRVSLVILCFQIVFKTKFINYKLKIDFQKKIGTFLTSTLGGFTAF